MCVGVCRQRQECMKSVRFRVRIVNPCNLLCGTHCVDTYSDLMQPAFYPSQRGQKAESYTLKRHYVHKPTVAIILQKCVCALHCGIPVDVQMLP